MDIKHPHMDLSFQIFIQTLHVTGDFSLLNQRRYDKEPSVFKWKHSSEKREQLGINVAVWHQHLLVFGPVSSTSKHTCSKYTEYKEILEITHVSVIGALCWREVLKCWVGNSEYTAADRRHFNTILRQSHNKPRWTVPLWPIIQINMSETSSWISGGNL